MIASWISSIPFTSQLLHLKGAELPAPSDVQLREKAVLASAVVIGLGLATNPLGLRVGGLILHRTG
jgi:hypothetical protein